MKILHLEDSPADAELVQEFLRSEWPHCEVSVVSCRPSYIEALAAGPHDVILSDFSMAAFSGSEGFELARVHEPETPFIFFSGTIREEVAIDAMREGAADYVLKDRPMRLIQAIQRALAKKEESERRRLAEQRIREQAELLDKARDAIVVTDLENRIVSWNEGARRMLGWTDEETIGQRIERFLGLNSVGIGNLDTTDEWQGELEVQSKTGRPLTLQMHVTVVRDEAGRPRARVSISTDVTETNRLKEQFFRAQRLESLGMLAAGIAHDLNNILAPLLMVPTLLRVRMTDPGDLKILDLLEGSAQRGTNLVRQILAFARGNSGTRQSTDVKPLLRDLAAFVQQTFPRDITLEAHVADNLRPVIASASQLHQVLLNLCVNARDAMPGGGCLRLRGENLNLDAATAATLEGAQPGRWIVLHIEDSGTGIPPEVVQRIWEPFFTTKSADKGTGLGLSTVRGIVESHGGFVTLDTAVGRGTTFRVHLPAEPVPTASPFPAGTPPLFRA